MAYTHEVVLDITIDRGNTAGSMATKWVSKNRSVETHKVMAVDVTKEQWCKKVEDSPLGTLPNTGRLYVVGHCQPGDARIYNSIQATHGVHWYELARFLSLNLTAASVREADSDPHLMISLISCHAGRGWQEGDEEDKPYVEKSFALRFHRALGHYGVYARVHARTLTTTVFTTTGSKFTAAKGKGLSEQNQRALEKHSGYGLLGSKFLIHWTMAKKQRYSNKEIDEVYLDKGLKTVNVFEEYRDSVKMSLLMAGSRIKDPETLWKSFHEATDSERMDQFVDDVLRRKGMLFTAKVKEEEDDDDDDDDDDINTLVEDLRSAKPNAIEKALRPTLRVFPSEDVTTSFSFGDKPEGMP